MPCGKSSGDLLREYEKAEEALRKAMPKAHQLRPGERANLERMDTERIGLITRCQKRRDDAYAAWQARVA